MEDISLSRKERERIFRKKEIMDAAIRVFAEKGFNSCTLEEIAGTAEFGKGTLYNYFQGKEEIYRAIINDVIVNQEKIIKEADNSSKTFIEFVELCTSELFNYCVKNKNAFLIFVREVARLDRDYRNVNYEELFQSLSVIRKIFVKRVEVGIKAREIRNFNPEKVMLLYKHLVFPHLHHILFCSPAEINVEDEINFILSVLFDGIKSK
ncbi:MAG: hypothetical protein A2330_09815 [Ignavibacteria bacterium RIFOXYB2_FULL_36_7]|nr:MAG: hypothetical protein A2330_09815 [Ignavibacteria bacterium RIFOXYB2_FULL_36_7]